jgi:3-phenylpropionate/trans-cinnamate dioxygenase alpha subunit
VPYLKEAYPSRLDRREWGLVRVRTAVYAGLVFGTLDRAAMDLDEYLGGFQFYLDIYLKQGPGGSQVYGPPDRWVAETDWKICAENFSGDGYHTPVAHQFGFHLGYFPSSGASHSKGWAVHIPGRGHGIGLGHTPGMPPFFGYPDELVAQMRQSLSSQQLDVFAKTRTAVGSVFPNLSFLIQPFSLVPGEPGVRFCTMRLWHPIGPGRMEMWSWCLVPTDAPEDYKTAAYRAYTLTFGQAGTFEQDDFENWTKVTRQAGSSMARDMHFPYLMGLGQPPLPDWPGPGYAVSPYVTDTNFRNLWTTWLDYLTREG